MLPFRHRIQIPQREPHLVARPRIRHQLQAIAQRRVVTLVAPAGYGKTSVLIDFVHTDAPYPVCWYALNAFDRDPWTFFTYLCHAVGTQIPALLDQEFAQRNVTVSWEVACTTLVQELDILEHDIIVLFDDWHLVDDVPEIQTLMTMMITQCRMVHIILASRTHIGLPNMMLLTGRRQLVGLGEDVLRVDGTEVAAILEQEYQTAVPHDLAQVLSEQMDGWITGILLSYTGSSTAVPPQATRQEITIGHPIYQFFAEQTFEQQPPEMQAFLLDSALLEDLSTDHCETILQHPLSRRMLGMLRTQHLFVSEIEPGVLRYHPLFREFLLERYRTTHFTGYQAMAQRVAGWYQDLQQWSPAFDLYWSADDQAAAAALVTQGAPTLFRQGRLETLTRWFRLVPTDLLSATALCIHARLRLEYQGDYVAAQQILDRARACVQPQEQSHVFLVEAYAFRHAGNFTAAITAGERALALAQDATQRVSALRLVAICRYTIGAHQQSLTELQQALTLEQQRGEAYTVALIQQDLGYCYEGMGMLTVALTCYRQADAYWQSVHNVRRRALLVNNIGVIQHLMGQYQHALHTFDEALRLTMGATTHAYAYAGIQLSLGDLWTDLQQWHAATHAYDQVAHLRDVPDLTAFVSLARVRLWVRQEQYQVAETLLMSLDLSHHPYRTLLHLFQVRIWIGLGRIAEARTLLDTLVAAVADHPHTKDGMYAALMQAILLAHTHPAAVDQLVHWLDIAAQRADQLGYDQVLALDVQLSQSLLRRARTAGWPRANQWLSFRHEAQQTGAWAAAPTHIPQLVVSHLGTDRILRNGDLITYGWTQVREVFAYLLIHSEGASIEELCEAIWSQYTFEEARKALRQAIYRLREQILPVDCLETRNRKRYWIVRDHLRLVYDVDILVQALNTPAIDPTSEAYVAALDSYHGPFLPESDSLWVVHQRTVLEQQLLHGLRRSAHAYETQDTPQDALGWYQRIVAIDMFDEAAHIGIMRCALAMRHRALVMAQYRTLQRIVQDELGVAIEHDSEAERLYQRAIALDS